MIRSCRSSVALRAASLLLVALVACAAAGSVGCTQSGDPRGQGLQTLDNNDRFKQVLTPDPAPETQLLSYHLIQVNWDPANPHNRKDLGYLREEKLIIRVKPWDARNENGFIVRLPGSFKHAVRQEDGRLQMWEAVEKRFFYVMDLTGRPVGQIDEFGAVKKWEPGLNRMVDVGSGSAEQAAMMLFDLNEDVQFDREREELIHSRPQIYMQLMDSNMATARKDRVAEDRFAHTGEITDISSDALARITLDSPEAAAGFSVGDRLRFIDVQDPEYGRSLARSPIASVIEIQDNVITTNLDGRSEMLRGSFESGRLGIINEFERDKLYNDPDRIWNR